MIITCGWSFASSDKPDAEDTAIRKDWHIGPRIGISPYTGLIGLEVQYKHFAFDAGYPGNVGIKYYGKPYGHSWFAGAHYLHFETDSSDLDDLTGLDGDTDRDEFGLGGGYRWRWGGGWDLSLSAALFYAEEKEESGSAWRRTQLIGIRPGIAFGYSF